MRRQFRHSLTFTEKKLKTDAKAVFIIAQNYGVPTLYILHGVLILPSERMQQNQKKEWATMIEARATSV